MTGTIGIHFVGIVDRSRMALPVILYQLWRFVAPGLYKSEKNAFLPFLLASPILFMIGASFAHYVVTPLAARWYLQESINSLQYVGIAIITLGVGVTISARIWEPGA